MLERWWKEVQGLSVDIERNRQTGENTATPNEEKDENTYGDEGHAVELVTGTHKNPHHSKVCRRNTRDRLHGEIDVRTTTAEDTMSAMAKLMGTAEESTSGVTDHRRIHATRHGEQSLPFQPPGPLMASTQSGILS